MAAAKAASEHVEALLAESWVPRSKAERLREMLQERLRLLESPELPVHSESYRRMVREVIEAQRKELLRLRDEGSIGDEARRAVEHDLDLEEASLQPVGSPPSPG